MRATTGHSDDPAAEDAIQEVIRQVEADLAGDEPKVALLFCSVDYEHDVLLSAIQDRWPGLPLIGSTSDGELSSRLGFRDDSVLLTVLSGDGLRVHGGIAHGLSSDIEGAVSRALTGMDLKSPRLCLTTPAPSTDTSAVLRAISRQLGDVSCPVLGGLSGDHGDFANMVEFFGGDVSRDSLPLLFIEGDIEVSWGTGSGWTGTGGEMTVTRAEGNRVFEIDHRPAVEAFKACYGELPSEFLGEFPLACKAGDGHWELRACMSVEKDDGILVFAGAVEEGATVRFTDIREEGLLQGSEDSLATALDEFEGQDPQLALIFTCAARKWVLGMEAAKEIDVLRALAEDRGQIDMAFAGLYCFGEIAPGGRSAASGFHNETCVSVVLGR